MIYVASYLSGFADGEGCFCVSFNKSARHRFGWDIRPSFSVSQNSDRAQVLGLYLKTWQCGTIRPDRSDKTLKFEVRAVGDLTSKVIPHFRKYPLLSQKQKDFEIFAVIVRMLFSKEHLNKAGFYKIVRLREELNSSGRKRYRQSAIKI